MYKTIVRAMIQRDITALNAGDPVPLRRRVAPDTERVRDWDDRVEAGAAPPPAHVVA